VAVKVNGLRASDKAALEKEVELFSRLSPHSNVVTVFGICSDAPDQKVRLVMQLCSEGSLLDWLKKERYKMDVGGREVCLGALDVSTVYVAVGATVAVRRPHRVH
jgi:serine/threonine protein kinase